MPGSGVTEEGEPVNRKIKGVAHCRRIPYKLSHKGCPRILEWIAYLSSSRSS